MNEEWKQIKGYCNRYLVSNCGRVKNLKTSHIFKGQVNGFGYPCVQLFDGKKYKTKSIHRFVAEAFLPEISVKTNVNHKDGDKTNNHVSNLEWSSQSNNLKHAFKIGLKNNNHQKKPCVAYMGEEMYLFESLKEGATKLGVCKDNVSHACRGGAKTAGGYYWKFI